MRKLYCKIRIAFWKKIVKKAQDFWFWCLVREGEAKVRMWAVKGAFDSEKSKESIDRLIEDWNAIPKRY